MATAVQVEFNGHANNIVGDAPSAVRHVLYNLLGCRGGPERLDALLTDERAELDYLSDAGAAVTDVMIARRAALSEGREAVVMTVHDLDALPGHDTRRLHVDIVNDHDPSWAMLDAVRDAYEEDMDRGRVETRLAAALRAAFQEAGSGPGSLAGVANRDEAALRTLRGRQDLFGPPPGHPFRLVPDAVPGEDATAILKGIPALAAERLSEVLAALEPSSPAP